MKLLCLALAIALAGCARAREDHPFVESIEVKSQLLAFLPTSTPALSTEVTLRKSSLLGRAFLYGSSLQFASIQEEEEEDPAPVMAIALGQLPAEFRIVNQSLRLVSDARSLFESDINAPSRLIHEFPILRQDADTLTIRAQMASPVLESFLFSSKSKASRRASWIRSMEFAPVEDLLLIESSIELSDGSVAEFMETLTPRARQVPEGLDPIYDDADLNPQARRFRFLSGEKVYVDHPEEGRVQTTVAQRFLWKGEPIRWWVTRNIPEENLMDVKHGVEAWNRYSRALGIPDLVRFEGLLPEGAKVGDPRYNLIVWDNIADADAAYESQAADPVSGIQSHSLIYLPSAWIEIGKDYWKDASGTESRERKAARLSRLFQSRRFAGRALPVHCVEGAHLHLTPGSQESPEEFGRSLLKSVIFHEMGHALGLAHNFKGSLSFEADEAAPSFSHSIMDYNLYNEEASAFSSLETADGPVLEYDRQILSVLYNEGKDLRETDPVLPVCSDDEADSKKGGIDPLCARYDIGNDPTRQALRSLELLKNAAARSGRMTSLPMALGRLFERLPAPAGIRTLAEAKKALGEYQNSSKGLVNLYVGASANSLAYQGSQALRALYVFKPGILPPGYLETEMRERALSLLEAAGETQVFPTATRAALRLMRERAGQWPLATPAFEALSEQQKAEELGKIQGEMEKHHAAMETAILSKLRIRLANALKYNADAPLSFHVRGSSTLDLEAYVIGLLERLAGAGPEPFARPLEERMAAVKVLSSYKSVGIARESQSRLKEALADEIGRSRDAREREALRKLLEALGW